VVCNSIIERIAANRRIDVMIDPLWVRLPEPASGSYRQPVSCCGFVRPRSTFRA
jgi:hypothetical protein